MWGELEEAGSPLLTTEWVFGETVSFVRRRVGYDAARALGEALRSSSILEIVHVDEALVERAWEAFLAYRFDGLSLVDCISFVTMRSRRVRRAFTFDDDFRRAGFDIVV